MRDRHLDDESADARARGRVRLIGNLAARIAAAGLVTAGSAVMAVATVGGPSLSTGRIALADQPTLLPLPIIGACEDLSLSAIVTTLTLPYLTCTATHAGEQTSSDDQTAVTQTSVSGPATSSRPTSNGVGRATAASASPSTALSVTSSSSASSTAVGVLGANTGTPSTGTDIAFGVGIGLVIAGAGIGTGTAEFFKRRRRYP